MRDKSSPGVLTQKLGDLPRPVAYFSKKKLDQMATGWLGCLRAVTAAALLVEAASKQVLPGTITEVLTPHQIQGVLEAKGHRW